MSIEHYLSEKELQHYKEKLEAKKLELIKFIEDKSLETRFFHAEDADVLDVSANLESKNRMTSEIDRSTKLLKRINKAIDNFVDFGYCIDCGIEIGQERLDFDPSVSRCFDCQDIHEKKQKHIFKS